MTERIRLLGPNHALLCGMVAGALARRPAGDDLLFEISLELVAANFTGRTLIRRPSGTWAVQIVPVEVSEL
jgi:hypothetical protein